VLASIEPPPVAENVIVTFGGVPPLAVSGVAVKRCVPFALIVNALRPRVTLSRAVLSGVADVEVAKLLFPSELLANTLNWYDVPLVRPDKVTDWTASVSPVAFTTGWFGPDGIELTE
tara:strand:- start:64 stop:414 length:351 start_codon:yes stop_codon:yes gene_type:complete